MGLNSIINEDIETIVQSDVNWHKLRNCTILITGANGFLPAYMVETLLYLNYIDHSNNITIIGLVRNIERAKKRFFKYLDIASLHFIEQDVSEPFNITKEIDYIIHAASQASPKFYSIDPVGTLKANVVGTINLLELARKNKIKSFLYFSSAEVYGDVELTKIPIEENTFGFLNPTQIRSCYSESKRMGENICISYKHQFDLPVKIVRPFHTYGPGMKLDDGRVYADFVSDVLKNQDICMKSDGSAIRAFCYLTDATIGFFKILLNGEDGQAYNVGNPNQEFSILQLAEIIVNIFPEKGIKVNKVITSSNNEYVKSTVSRISPSIKKISKLNWIPLVNVKEGFKRTIQSYNKE